MSNSSKAFRSFLHLNQNLSSPVCYSAGIVFDDTNLWVNSSWNCQECRNLKNIYITNIHKVLSYVYIINIHKILLYEMPKANLFTILTSLRSLCFCQKIRVTNFIFFQCFKSFWIVWDLLWKTHVLFLKMSESILGSSIITRVSYYGKMISWAVSLELKIILHFWSTFSQKIQFWKFWKPFVRYHMEFVLISAIEQRYVYIKCSIQFLHNWRFAKFLLVFLIKVTMEIEFHRAHKYPKILEFYDNSCNIKIHKIIE